MKFHFKSFDQTYSNYRGKNNIILFKNPLYNDFEKKCYHEFIEFEITNSKKSLFQAIDFVITNSEIIERTNSSITCNNKLHKQKEYRYNLF